MTGFHERAKMRENISHGCKAMRGKAPGRVACLEFAEGEKRTAITTDRAVEDAGSSSTAFLCRYGGYISQGSGKKVEYGLEVESMQYDIENYKRRPRTVAFYYAEGYGFRGLR